MSKEHLCSARPTAESKTTRPLSSSKPWLRENNAKDSGLDPGASKTSQGPPGTEEVISSSRSLSLCAVSDSEDSSQDAGTGTSVRRYSLQDRVNPTGAGRDPRGPRLAAAQFWRDIETGGGKSDGKRGIQKIEEEGRNDGRFTRQGRALGSGLGTSLERSWDPEGVRRAAEGSPRKRDEERKCEGALNLWERNSCGREGTQRGQVPSGGSRESVSVKQTIRSFESILKPGLVGRRASQYEPSKRLSTVDLLGKNRARSRSVPSLLRQPSSQQGQNNIEDRGPTRCQRDDASSELQDGPRCVARQQKPESPWLRPIGGMADGGGGRVWEGSDMEAEMEQGCCRGLETDSVGALVTSLARRDTNCPRPPAQRGGQLGDAEEDLSLSASQCPSTPMAEVSNDANREGGGQCLLPELDVVPSLVGFPVESSPLTSWTGLDQSLERAAIFPSLRSDDEWSMSDESEMMDRSWIDQLDRSYSISLAELRECGPGWREDNRMADMLDRSASLQSNASFVSLIPGDELDLLIEEVKGLDDSSFESADDIRVVVLRKEEGVGLGFSIAGGEDCETKRVTVHRVFISGLAAQEGTIQRGDEILSINGSRMQAVAHSEALASLRKARPLRQAVVVLRRETKPALSPAQPTLTGVSEGSGPEGRELTVELSKGSCGLGFSLDGGKGSSHGDKPLTVKKVFQGGLAASSRLIEPGDRVMEIQGVTLRDLTCYEAWNLIKSLPAGPVSVLIRKSVEQPDPNT